jgi:WD40 repeat protein
VRAVAVTPDGRQALSGSPDGTLRLWDLASGQALHTFTGHSEEVWAIAVTPDGRTLVSGGVDGTVRVWRLPAGLLGPDAPPLTPDPSPR